MKTIEQKGIVVFGTATCEYCIKVKEVLTEKGLEFTEMPTDGDSFEALDNAELLKGMGFTTIPQVFIEGKHVGGHDETVAHLESLENLVVGEDISYRETVKLEQVQKSMVSAITNLQIVCHGLAVEGGWWDRRGDALDAHNLLMSGTVTDPTTAAILTSVANQERNVGEMLALIHSEVSEAMDGARKGLMDDHLPTRSMLEVELADTIVRILDMAGGMKLDVAGALVEKLVYNITRKDHQLENRESENGKKF